MGILIVHQIDIWPHSRSQPNVMIEFRKARVERTRD